MSWRARGSTRMKDIFEHKIQPKNSLARRQRFQSLRIDSASQTNHPLIYLFFRYEYCESDIRSRGNEILLYV